MNHAGESRDELPELAVAKEVTPFTRNLTGPENLPRQVKSRRALPDFSGKLNTRGKRPSS
jgi:hypothetical protein